MKNLLLAALIAAAPPPYIHEEVWEQGVPPITRGHIEEGERIAYHSLRHGEETKKFFREEYGLSTEVFFNKPIILNIMDIHSPLIDALHNYPLGIRNVTINTGTTRDYCPNKFASIIIHELAHYADWLNDGEDNNTEETKGYHEGNLAEAAFWRDIDANLR